MEEPYMNNRWESSREVEESDRSTVQKDVAAREIALDSISNMLSVIALPLMKPVC